MTPPTALCPACHRSVFLNRGRLMGHYLPDSAQQCPGTGLDATPPPPPRDPSKDLLTVAEVAAIARVSKMTIYRVIERKELTGIRIGRSVRIRRGDVDQYLTDAEVGR